MERLAQVALIVALMLFSGASGYAIESWVLR